MVSKKTLKIGILAGTSGAGKSALAHELCRDFPRIEIINADSIAFYREAEIGSAKPTTEQRQHVPHHLIDIADPDENLNAGDFCHHAKAAIADIHRRGKRALLVGGTGFYLKALTHGMWLDQSGDEKIRRRLELKSNEELYEQLGQEDPESTKRIDPNDRYRLVRALEIIATSGQLPSQLDRSTPREPDPRYQLWFIDREKSELDRRILQRTEDMIGMGLIDEVRSLLKTHPKTKVLSAVGYRQTVHYLQNEKPAGRRMAPGEQGLRDEIALATRHLAKAQRTWFRKEPEAKRFQLDRDRADFLQAFQQVYG